LPSFGYDGTMNIFYVHADPKIAAEMHCDKHVVKMIVEAAQMLSTAHRICDGIRMVGKSKTGRKKTDWVLSDKTLESVLYKTVHVNHPSTVWTRESLQNYEWHYKLFASLCAEYCHRYGKEHATWVKLDSVLRTPPKNIPSLGFTPVRLAMKSNPECMFPEDPLKSYRLFYQTKQARFKMTWTKRNVPEWFQKK
jgi:hypothetical protein